MSTGNMLYIYSFCNYIHIYKFYRHNLNPWWSKATVSLVESQAATVCPISLQQSKLCTWHISFSFTGHAASSAPWIPSLATHPAGRRLWESALPHRLATAAPKPATSLKFSWGSCLETVSKETSVHHSSPQEERERERAERSLQTHPTAWLISVESTWLKVCSALWDGCFNANCVIR